MPHFSSARFGAPARRTFRAAFTSWDSGRRLKMEGVAPSTPGHGCRCREHLSNAEESSYYITMSMDRRTMLSGTAASAAVIALGTSNATAKVDDSPPSIIDTNVSLFQWPFRRLPADEPSALVAQLKLFGIRKAWAGSYEALLHRDVAGVNERLTDACRSYGEGRLVPIGTVNPSLPDWAEDLRRCHEAHRMAGIRVYPNYHDYDLSSPVFARLLKLTAQRGLFVQLAVAMEDVRTQHPLVQVKDVELRPLADLVSGIPGVRVQLLNHRPRTAELLTLAKVDGIHFDISRVDDTSGVSRIVRALPRGRVMFGSHAPFLIQQAALIRSGETDLNEGEQADLFSRNAAAFIRNV